LREEKDLSLSLSVCVLYIYIYITYVSNGGLDFRETFAICDLGLMMENFSFCRFGRLRHGIKPENDLYFAKPDLYFAKLELIFSLLSLVFYLPRKTFFSDQVFQLHQMLEISKNIFWKIFYPKATKPIILVCYIHEKRLNISLFGGWGDISFVNYSSKHSFCIKSSIHNVEVAFLIHKASSTSIQP
jgi:hypothetical protein